MSVGSMPVGAWYARLKAEDTFADYRAALSKRVIDLRDANQQLREMLEDQLPALQAQINQQANRVDRVAGRTEDVAGLAQAASERADRAAAKADQATHDATRALDWSRAD